jgi:hypothetical protein
MKDTIELWLSLTPTTNEPIDEDLVLETVLLRTEKVIFSGLFTM